MTSNEMALMANIAIDMQKNEVNEVLDKIRAKIEAYQSDAFYHDDVMINKRVVLEIIDKYKAESEVK